MPGHIVAIDLPLAWNRKKLPISETPVWQTQFPVPVVFFECDTREILFCQADPVTS